MDFGVCSECCFFSGAKVAELFTHEGNQCNAVLYSGFVTGLT